MKKDYIESKILKFVKLTYDDIQLIVIVEHGMQWNSIFRYK